MSTNRFVSGLLSVGLAANGLAMIVEPRRWYWTIPGVPETGAFNPQFIRDIGAAFLVSAIGVGWHAIASGPTSRSSTRAPILMAALFLMMHAIVHVSDLLAGREDAHHLSEDALTIFLPALVALGLAFAPRPKRSRRSPRVDTAQKGVLARLTAPALAKFEDDFGYDTTYLRDVVRISPRGFLRFGLFTLFANHREDTPADAWFAAKLVAAMREDCGPCTQLVVTMAERAYGANQEGDAPVSAKTLRAILEGDEDGMSPSASLAYRFANAVLDRDLVRADSLRQEIVHTWGERALVTLSFAIASSRVYPTMKYALGHGRACSRVTVGQDIVAVHASPVFSPSESH